MQKLAYRHARIWQADEAAQRWQAARSVGSVGRCTCKSQQLVNAKLIRELLRPLRVLALVCNLAAFTQRRCTLHSGGLRRLQWCNFEYCQQKRAVQQQTPRSAAMCIQCAAPGRLPLPSRHVPETARASRHLTIARGLSRRASNKWRTHRHEAASVRQARGDRCRAGPGL